jgi:flagellar hook-basal body complex protein FliE
LAKKQELTESAQPAVAEGSTGDYSAKKAAAGKDIGKPGKAFAKIAKSAGQRYGSKAAGERVAGAVLNKLRAKNESAGIDPNRNPQTQDYSQGGDVMDYLNDKLKDFDTQQSKTDESAFQAAIGKKKYGEKGMKALQKAGRDGASAKTMSNIRNRYDKYDESQGMTDEGNAFAKAVIDAKKDGVQPGEKIRVGGKEYPVKEEGSMPMTAKQKSFAKLAPPADKITFADKIAGAKKEVDEMLGDVAAEAIKNAIGKKKEPRSKGTAFDPEVAKTMTATDKHPRYDVKDTGYSKRYTRKTEEPKDDDDSKDIQADKYAGPKKKGRPKGPEKGPERVTAKSYKFKAGRPAKTKEDLDVDGVMMTKPSNMSSEDVSIADRGEYDQEGDMAKDQLHTLTKAANELSAILDDEQNLPEWVQSKITKALDYINAANDYMDQEEHDDEKAIAEKAVSKKQRRAAGIAHAAQKGEIPKKELRGASKEMSKMPGGELKKFAKTKETGLPEKVKDKKEESVEETSEAPKEKKSSGGFQFGKGVYESMDKRLTQALNEGMNVSINMNSGADGNPTKSITVSAEGEDAEALAQLLKMAGLGGNAETCPTCGKSDCGCQSIDENSPDWPTNTETSDDALQYSGGLNKPKSTGQTTVPVVASQLRRQVSMEEGVTLERSLFKLYQNYKAQ